MDPSAQTWSRKGVEWQWQVGESGLECGGGGAERHAGWSAAGDLARTNSSFCQLTSRLRVADRKSKKKSKVQNVRKRGLERGRAALLVRTLPRASSLQGCAWETESQKREGSSGWSAGGRPDGVARANSPSFELASRLHAADQKSKASLPSGPNTTAAPRRCLCEPSLVPAHISIAR